VTERPEGGDHVRGRRGVDHVAPDRRDVLDLVSPADFGALDEGPPRAREGRRALEASMRDPRAERDRPVHVDGIESGEAMEADDVPRRAPATADLDQEIGAAGEEAALRATPRAELDGFATRRGLVVVEAHRSHERALALKRCSGDGPLR
jgi:hypothetical protein